MRTGTWSTRERTCPRAICTGTSLAVASLASLVMLALGCSSTTASGGAITKTIGPEGGTIVVEGATVTFPANALTTPTAITITPSDDAPPAGYVALSRVVRCAPSGTTFAVPVTMAMTFDGDPSGATMFWSSGEDASFKDVGVTASGS